MENLSFTNRVLEEAKTAKDIWLVVLMDYLNMCQRLSFCGDILLYKDIDDTWHIAWWVQ